MTTPRWGMVIDLGRCIGCSGCKETCAQFNGLPRGAQWRRVIEKTLGEGSERVRVFISMGCMHCGEPSCVGVCPTGATRKRPDGIVIIDPNSCIGCGACILACPYRARSITLDDPIRMPGEDPGITSFGIGVCTKCDFCCDRIDAGLEKGLKPGVDAAATPICVRYCLGEALHFGDLNDPDSDVSRLIRENPHVVRMNQSLGNDPAVFYIPVNEEHQQTHESDPHHPA